MSNPSTINPGMASFLLISAAKGGDLSLMRTLLDCGANPDCWVGADGGKRRPLTTVVAEGGQVEAAVRLLQNISDEMIATNWMGDWRADYALSPLASFVRLGAPGPAARMLARCRDTMTQEQWADLLFTRVNCLVKADFGGLVDECVSRLNREQVQAVKARVSGQGRGRPEPWSEVEAALSRQALESDTSIAGVRTGPINRM